MDNAKKHRKTIGWERLEVSIIKLEIPILPNVPKGTFHEEMGTIRDRNGMDLTEAEENKKRFKNTWKNSTKKKVLMIQITMMVWSLT